MGSALVPGTSGKNRAVSPAERYNGFPGTDQVASSKSLVNLTVPGMKWKMFFLSGDNITWNLFMNDDFILLGSSSQ